MDTNDVPVELTRAILGSAIAVHRELGPGLLESTKVLVELKAVDDLSPLHAAQTLTYLHHSRMKVGLIINFNVPRLMHGVRRFVR